MVILISRWSRVGVVFVCVVIGGCAGSGDDDAGLRSEDVTTTEVASPDDEMVSDDPEAASDEPTGLESEEASGVRVRYRWVQLRHFFESGETVVCVTWWEPWAGCGVLASVRGLGPSSFHEGLWEDLAGDGDWVQLGRVDVEGVVFDGVLSDPVVYLEWTGPLERECNYSGGEVQMRGIPHDPIALSSGHPVFVWNASRDYLDVSLNYGTAADFDEICDLGAHARIRSWGEVLEP